MYNDEHKPLPASFQAYTCMISNWIKIIYESIIFLFVRGINKRAETGIIVRSAFLQKFSIVVLFLFIF